MFSGKNSTLKLFSYLNQYWTTEIVYSYQCSTWQVKTKFLTLQNPMIKAIKVEK